MTLQSHPTYVRFEAFTEYKVNVIFSAYLSCQLVNMTEPENVLLNLTQVVHP
jgi:hypothetical protein